MEKIKGKLSFLTALNAIFLKSDDVIDEEEKNNEMQINDINSSSELSEKDKEMLLKSVNNIKFMEEQYMQQNITTKNVAKKVKIDSVKAVTEASRKLEHVKNGNEIEEKEKN